MYLTTDELELISTELDMVKESRQICLEDGEPDTEKYRREIELIDSIGRKIALEILRRQVRQVAGKIDRSKWDRFRK